MKLRLMQARCLCWSLAACGASPIGEARTQPRRREPPFTDRRVATFDSPWAMDFLPGSSTTALVTEKAGRALAGRRRQRREAAGRGRARGRRASQGGLLDVDVSPRLRGGRLVYLTYSEAVVERRQRARAWRGRKLVDRRRRAARRAAGPLARSGGRRGRPVRRADRLRARRQVAVPELRRAAALHAGAGPEPAAGQDPAPDARRQSRRRAIRWPAGPARRP